MRLSIFVFSLLNNLNFGQNTINVIDNVYSPFVNSQISGKLNSVYLSFNSLGRLWLSHLNKFL